MRSGGGTAVVGVDSADRQRVISDLRGIILMTEADNSIADVTKDMLFKLYKDLSR